MVSTMERARDALRGLTLEADGVDGGGMLLYGEGWDFGEVTLPAGDARCTSCGLLQCVCSCTAVAPACGVGTCCTRRGCTATRVSATAWPSVQL